MANVEVAEAQPIYAPVANIRTAGFWLQYGAVTLIYIVAISLTRPIFISDSLHYLRTANPNSALFWDFGHLAWRPLLWIVFRSPSSPAEVLRAFHILDLASSVAGLIGLWFTVATLRLFISRVVPVVLISAVLSFSQAVLTHSKGSCAYIYGFTALSIAFYRIVAAEKLGRTDWWGAAIPGSFMALAVCLWFPYILAVPGTLCAPILLSEGEKKRWGVVLKATIICALLGSLGYGAVAAHLGIRNASGFISWAAQSSHGVTTSGLSRVFFGLCRSFIALGEGGAHGVAFKRFLHHDPYNPVTIWQLLDWTFRKIVLFYIFFALVLRSLSKSTPGRRVFGQLLAVALPVLVFAFYWAGTDLERYLPLFPALIVALGLGLDEMRFPSMTACVACVFILVLIVSNFLAFSSRVRERQLQQLTETVRDLNSTLPSKSLVLLSPMDPLQRIYWDFPEALPLAEHQLTLERLVDLGTTDSPRWHTRVCSEMREAWSKQASVVIRSSLLQERPAQNSPWVEGDDPRVRWRDINNFTSRFELGSRAANTDFFFVPATTRNLKTVDQCSSD